MATTISILENLSGGHIALIQEADRLTVSLTMFYGSKSQDFGTVERQDKDWRFNPEGWPCPEIVCRTAKGVAMLAWSEWQRAHPKWRKQIEAQGPKSSGNPDELFRATLKASKRVAPQ